MEKKSKIKTIIHGAEKTAKGLWEKSKDFAVQIADQNDDGKLDFSDVAVIADSIGNAMKNGAHAVIENAEEKTRQAELKTLKPIFVEDLDSTDFFMSKLIRITERDKKHTESEVCKGSIGYITEQKEFRIINVFKDSIDSFCLTFYPDCDCEFYYIDPSDRDHYIALTEYFNYMRIVRINELQTIAQDLGAKFFKVTYKEEISSLTTKSVKAQAKVAPDTASAEHNFIEKKFSTTDITGKMEFLGHAPVTPHLKYLQRDPCIQNLIKLRLHETTPLQNQTLSIKLSNSCGLKESDALKIDTVLKGLKYAGNIAVANEARNESKRYLEYEIEF